MNKNYKKNPYYTNEDIKKAVKLADDFFNKKYRPQLLKTGNHKLGSNVAIFDLPSIVTDINGSREIIIEGENGIIIPTHDTNALYKAMKAMVDNPQQRKAMASKARDLVSTRFEQGYVRQCLFDFYLHFVWNRNGIDLCNADCVMYVLISVFRVPPILYLKDCITLCKLIDKDAIM
jgi:hypothetical protein